MRDDRTELERNAIHLYVDGSEKMNFTYDPAEDRLRYTSGRLSFGTHTARVVATDAAGNTNTQEWRFRVVR